MKFKKKKYSFSAPEKYKTGEALHGEALPRTGEPPVAALPDAAVVPPDKQPEPAAAPGDTLSPERAERLLRTVELTRAEIDKALAAQGVATRDMAAVQPHSGESAPAQIEEIIALEPAAEVLPATAQVEIAQQTTEKNQPEAKLAEPAGTQATAVSESVELQPAAAAEQSAETTEMTAPQATVSGPQPEATAPFAPEPTVEDPHDSDIQTAPDAPSAPAAPESVAEKTAMPERPDTFWRRLVAPANLAFLLLAFLLLGPIYLVNYGLGGLYYLREDGETAAILFSAADDPAGVFAKAGIELHEADVVEETALGDCVWLTVTRAYDVTVFADGQTYDHKVLGHTTAEALAQLGIEVGPDDICTPAADKVLVEGETIRVQRVVYETRAVTEVVAWQEITKPSPLIREGRTQVMNANGQRDGLADRVYRDKYVDGELVESEIIEEKYDDFPWNIVTLEGDPDAIMSPIDGAQFTDVTIVDNVPTQYERVMENAVCTAYSFKPGTYGASGMYMFQGFVAVNTNVIPYGSLLYITSPTGKFTYGWAIAADVGEAMMAGYVDIDLFFETYTESALFGKHRLNVYVVDQLTQSELEQFMAQPGMFRARVPAG